MKKLEEVLRSGKATIIDVRSPGEYMGAHVPGSINIPLQEIPKGLPELKNLKNIVLCCASGGRSGQATEFLKQNDIDCINGGSWMNVSFYY